MCTRMRIACEYLKNVVDMFFLSLELELIADFDYFSAVRHD